MELRTPRLILREWREEDFAFSYALATDPEVMRYASREPVDAEAVRRLLGRRIAATMMQPRTHFGLAVTLAETGEVLGRCGLYLADDPRVAWISYELQRDQWGMATCRRPSPRCCVSASRNSSCTASMPSATPTTAPRIA